MKMGGWGLGYDDPSKEDLDREGDAALFVCRLAARLALAAFLLFALGLLAWAVL